MICIMHPGSQPMVPLHHCCGCRAGCKSWRQPCRRCSRPPPRRSPRHGRSAHRRGRLSAGARSRSRRCISSRSGRLWRRWQPEPRWWLPWRTSLCSMAAAPAMLPRGRAWWCSRSCMSLEGMACSHYRTFNEINSHSLTAGLSGTATALTLEQATKGRLHADRCTRHHIPTVTQAASSQHLPAAHLL